MTTKPVTKDITVNLVSECAPTRRLPSTSQSLAGWQGRRRGRGTNAAVFIIPLGSCSGEGLDGMTAAAAGSGWTVPGPSGYLKNALLRCCLGCYVADYA